MLAPWRGMKSRQPCEEIIAPQSPTRAAATTTDLDRRLRALPGRTRAIFPMTEAAKLHAARLGSLESGFSPRRDHLALGLGDNRHDADDRLVRLGHVGRDEPDASLLKAQQEMRIARQATMKLGS
jgi:hypothetical protein